MRDTRVTADDLRAAIERTGYYPGLVTDAVWSSLGPEPVTAYVVTHDAIFDPGMEVRRHITVLALTPTRLIYSHTDEHPAEHRGGAVLPGVVGGADAGRARSVVLRGRGHHAQ
jgi:hypothetical protein